MRKSGLQKVHFFFALKPAEKQAEDPEEDRRNSAGDPGRIRRSSVPWQGPEERTDGGKNQVT